MKSTHSAETLAYVEIFLFGEIGCMSLITGVNEIEHKKGMLIGVYVRR